MPPPLPQQNSLMQATIKTVQQRQHYYVYLTLKFSKHALHLIEARQLQNKIIISGNPDPPPSQSSMFLSNAFVRIAAYVSPFLFVGACMYGIGGGLYENVQGKKGGSEGLAYFLMLVAVGLGIYALAAPTIHTKRVTVRRYTPRYFFHNPTIRFHASSPTHAKALDEEIREALLTFRIFLEDSKELPREQKYEL